VCLGFTCKRSRRWHHLSCGRLLFAHSAIPRHVCGVQRDLIMPVDGDGQVVLRNAQICHTVVLIHSTESTVTTARPSLSASTCTNNKHRWIQKASVHAQHQARSMALRRTGRAVLPTLAATSALFVMCREHTAVAPGFRAGLGFTGVVAHHPPLWWSRG